MLGALAFTAPPGETPAPDTGVLLSIADAGRHHRPVWIRYTAGDGRGSERTWHPYGPVAHSDRWYVTGADPGIGQDRMFRLDRIADARTLPGSFEPPAGFDPAQHVLSALATTPFRHEVTLRVQGTIEQTRARLPASVAVMEELPPARTTGRADHPTGRGADGKANNESGAHIRRLSSAPAIKSASGGSPGSAGEADLVGAVSYAWPPEGRVIQHGHVRGMRERL